MAEQPTPKPSRRKFLKRSALAAAAAAAAGTGGFANLAQLRDPNSGAVRHVLAGHTGFVNSLAFTPDGKTLVTASLDRTVRLWNVADGKHARTLDAHAAEVLSVAVSADGKTMVTGSRDKRPASGTCPTATGG